MSATPPVLYLKDICLSLGKDELFADLNLQLYKNDRVCLVGKNGSGKSTLLKIIAGLVEATDGKIFIQPGLKVGYLPQTTIFPEEQTIYQYVLNDKHSDENRYLADIILEKLKVPNKGLMKHLSGGMQRRASLARSLVENPDIVLLDEPTNHLDIESIIWLEQYLNEYKGSVICISHDRRFLDNISNRTWWLYKRQIYSNNKGFKFFDEWSDIIRQQQIAELKKLHQQLDTENAWLAYGVTARRKRNQGRLEKLHQLRAKLKNENSELNKQNQTLKIDELNKKNSAKIVLEMNNVSLNFSHEQQIKEILNNFSMRIIKGERIGIIGANGSGKSSFLKLITGELKPDSGKIKLGANLEISYFDQNRNLLNPEKTLWETLCPNGGDQIKVNDRFMHVVAYLKNFMFDSKQAHSPVSSLSGGEASRLLLAKLLANPGNFLIFDEPTNDLDMDTLDILEELLTSSKSTMLIVSHDREFLDRITTRSLVFKGDGEIIDYFGGYSDYKDFQKISLNKSKNPTQISKSENDQVKVSNKLTYTLQRELDLLPGKIDKINEEIEQLNIILSDANLFDKDPGKFNQTIKNFEKKKAELEQFELRWLELAEMAEQYKN
jgi:ATP-binding cassette subfamily F protein uup